MIEDYEVDSILRDLPKSQPDVQTEMRKKLADWRVQKKQESDDRMESIFLDPDKWGGHWTPEHQTLAEQTLSPNATKAGMANLQWIADQEGKSTDDIADALPAYRKAYSQKLFGKPDLSDEAFYSEVSTRYQGQKARREGFNQLLGDVALSTWEDMAKGTVTPAAGFVQKYREENPDFFKGIDGQAEVDTLSALSAASHDLRARFEKHAPVAKMLFDSMTSQTGQQSVEGAPSQPEVVGFLANMPAEDRTALYGAVALAAERKGFPAKNFLMQMGESLGRGTLGVANQTARVAYEETLRAELGAFQKGARMGTEDPAERAKAVEEIQGKLQAIKVIREISALAEQSDPIKAVSKGWLGTIEKGAYGVGGSVGYLAASAVPVVGPALTFSAIYAGEFERISLESPNLPPEKVSEFAALSALPQAAMDKLQINILTGKLPRFSKMLQDMALSRKGIVGQAKRFGAYAGSMTAAETGIEMAQNFVPIAIDQLGAALNEDYKDHDFQKDFAQWKDAAPETFVSMMILSMIGAGAATIGDVRNGRYFVESVKPLRMAGLSEEQAAQVVAEPSPEEKQAKFRELYAKRTPENIAEGVKIANAEAEKVRAEQKDTARATLESTPQEDGGNLYTARAADGRVIIQTTDAETAQVAIREENHAQFVRKTSGIGEAAAWFNQVNEAVGRGEDVQKLILNSAPQSLLAEYEANQTPENLDRLFETVRFFGGDPQSPADLGNYFVKASNRGAIKEGVYRSVIRVHDGADGVHVMRDFSQDNLKRAIAEGDTSIEWVRGQLAEIVKEKAFSGLRVESDTDVIEAFSDVAVAYFHGRIKEAQVPEGLRGFLRQIAVFLKDIFYRAYRLKRMTSEGRIGTNFQQLLASSVGLDADQIVEMESEKAMRRMEREALDAINQGEGALGDELLDVLKSAKLPDVKSPFWNEDFARIKEAVREHNKGKTEKQKIKLSDIFSNDAIDPDLNVIGALQENGFDFFTVDDLVQAVEDRIISGKPQRGTKLNAALQGADYSIEKKRTPAISGRGSSEIGDNPINNTVSIRAPEGATGLATDSSAFAFQSAPDFSGDEVKLPQWQSVRQPEILSERVKIARDAINQASADISTTSPVLRSVNIGGYPIGGGRVGDFVRGWLDVESNGVRDGYGNPDVPQNKIEQVLIPKIEAMLADARENLAQAEADLFLAMEEEGGRSDNLAAKESAAQWARRTKAAEFAALLDARDEKAKNAAQSFVSDVWRAFAAHDELFQYGRTDNEYADDIADAVSAPGKPVTVSEHDEQVTFIGKEGSLTIREADTDQPYIRSDGANSRGKEGGGGSQLYAAALDWIHNNGKRIKDDPKGLSEINAIRRTSNFLASALRWGTTKHLKPHAGQKVKWTKSDTLNTAALAAKEMENAFKAIPDARGWGYDFRSGTFRDESGNDLTRERLASAVRLGDPQKSGIGLATLQRAIITQSAIRAFERGESSESVLDAEGRGVVPIGVSYSIGKAGDDRVARAMESQLRRNPSARLAIYERAKAKFEEIRSRRGDSVDPNQKFSSLLQSMGELDAILKVLPAEIRGKVGGFMPLANLGKDTVGGNREQTIDKFLEKRIGMIGKELERALKLEYGAAMERILDRAKPAKSDPGKKPVGKLGQNVHALFDSIRAAMEMTQDEANDRIIALETEIGRGELTPEQESHKTLEMGMIAQVADWKNADAERRAGAVESARNLFDKGYLEYQTKKGAVREAREESRARLAMDTGTAGTAEERDERIKKDSGILSGLRDALPGLLNFDQAVKWVFGDASQESQRLADMERKASNRKEDRTQDKMDAVADLFTKLAGDKFKGEKLRWQMAQKTMDVAGRKLSELEAITAMLMWNQEDGQRHMLGKQDENGNFVSKWHYDQEFIDIIERDLSDEARAVMAFISDQYSKEWAELNPVYSELYGVNLPRHANYAPITVKPLQEAGMSIDPVTGSTMSNGSPTPGSLRTRGSSTAEPDFRDALQTYIAHTKQMEHWMAYAPFVAEARAILGNRDLGDSIEAKAGKQALTVVRGWLTYFEQGGTRDAAASLALSQKIGRALNRAASIALVGRIGTLAIQSTQLAAAGAKMPFGAYVSRLAKLFSGNLGWGNALNSDYIQRRIKQMPPAVQQAMDGLRSENPTMLKHQVQRIGTLLSGADGLFTAGTYSIVYDYQLKQAGELGLSGEEAEGFARESAERIVDEIAQPTRPGARSLMENTNVNPFFRLAWAFASEGRKNLGLLTYAAVTKDPMKISRAALYVLVLNSAIAELIRSAWRDMKDSDDDELFDERNWNPARLAMSVISSPLQGLPVFGDMLEAGAFKAAGQYLPEGNLLSAAPRAVTAAMRIDDMLAGEQEISETLRDVEMILAGMGLFHSDIAAAASLSHLVRDLYGVGENATENLSK